MENMESINPPNFDLEYPIVYPRRPVREPHEFPRPVEVVLKALIKPTLQLVTWFALKFKQ